VDVVVHGGFAVGFCGGEEGGLGAGFEGEAAEDGF